MLSVESENNKMQLTRAFGIRDKEAVAFVGGGGKTTALFQLAAELAAQGKRVVTTTTTRIFAAQIQLAPYHIVAVDNAQSLREVRRALREHAHVLVVGGTNHDGKAFGVEPALIDALIALDEVDVVLVEADGSRMRPFKAPAEHEPVVPDSTTLLVPVFGMDVLGKALNDENVHRAERVAALAGISLGETVNAQAIVQVIAHPHGGLKNRPAHARVIPLINKVENDAQHSGAMEMAQHLLTYDAIDAVAIGAVKNASSPISALESRAGAVILAAGGSTRMHKTKQLLRWGNGTLVQHAARIVSRARVSEIVLVTGNRADEIEKEIRELTADASPQETTKPLRVVLNPDWATGLASSVCTGVRALNASGAAGIFINADQPFLTTEMINQVLLRYAQTLAPIVVPLFDGKQGSPVLFARELFDELLSLTGDVGGRAMFEKHRAGVEKVSIDDARAAMDLDTPEEYAHALEMKE